MTSSPDRALWMAVVEQAMKGGLMDIDIKILDKRTKKNNMNAYHQRKAHQWIIGGSYDFKAVCSYAGLDPSYVQEQYKIKLREKENKKPGFIPGQVARQGNKNLINSNP